jgi:hypothetical protein
MMAKKNQSIFIMHKFLFSFLLTISTLGVYAQSFNDEKTSAINFVKRVYNSAHFEGIKKLEGEERNYYAVAVVLMNIPKDSVLSAGSKAQLKAQLVAEQGFAEPCIKFEMIDRIEKGNQNTYLFLCTTLEEFITEMIKKKSIDGARIISAPGNKYVVSTITLENAKYISSEMRDKAAFMKAKQLANTLVNGSNITSEQIIRTDETDKRTETTSTEVVKEHAMGFIQGLELLFVKEITQNKTTYSYYSKF